MRYLILLDRKFPYKTGEAFLENEIEEIANSFDKIIIYPSDIRKTDLQTRKIKASNVETRILENSSLRTRQVGYVFKGIRFAIFSKEKKIVHKAIDGYFLEAVDEQAKKIILDLEKETITNKDEVFIYSYWLYITAAVACNISKHLKEKNIKCTVFSRAHRFDIYEEKRKYGYLPLQENLLESLECVYACSDNGATYLKKKYPQYVFKIETSYLGTYDHGIGAVENRPPLRIVSCSRLSSVKRVEKIIEALSLLKNEKLEIEWTHLGGGEQYEKLKEEAKVLDWMKVDMRGTIPNSAVYEFYLNNPVDVFINVSSSEGLPVSIMEATSFGIPVIGTNVGGTCEIVVDGVSGKLIPADFKVDELAETIKKFALMNKSEYLDLRKSTRKMWEKYYQAPTNYAKFIESIYGLDKRK